MTKLMDVRKGLEKIATCEGSPCALCRGTLCLIAASDLLEVFKAAERREKRIRRARRFGT
jgi:hypothetical protein